LKGHVDGDEFGATAAALRVIEATEEPTRGAEGHADVHAIPDAIDPVNARDPLSGDVGEGFLAFETYRPKKN